MLLKIQTSVKGKMHIPQNAKGDDLSNDFFQEPLP